MKRPSRLHALALLLSSAGLVVAVPAQDPFTLVGKQALDPPVDGAWATAGDLDGDGRPDLLVTATTGPGPVLYRNDGAGGFVRSAVLPLLVNWESPILGDVDGDGDLDVFMGRGGPLWLVRNHGAAGFTDDTALLLPATLTHPWLETRDLDLGDLDGDGDLDLVVVRRMQPLTPVHAEVYRNDGSGRFTLAITLVTTDDLRQLRLADVDNDGDLDLVVAGGPVTLWRNDGAGNFTLTPGIGLPGDGSIKLHVLCSDLDGDGRLDLLVAPWQERLRLFRNTGTTFVERTAQDLPASAREGRRILVADFDGDGDADVAFSSTNLATSAHLLINDGTGRFIDTGDQGHSLLDSFPLAAADFDGNGAVDLLWGYRLQILWNRGGGAFVSGMPVRSGQCAVAALGDIDGDGDLDLYRAGQGLLRNLGDGTFAPMPAASLPALGVPTAAAFGDADGDGDQDLFLVMPDGTTNQLLINDGTGRFTAVPLPAVIRGGERLALFDADGDADLDAVIAGMPPQSPPPANPSVWLLRNDGTGRFSASVVTTPQGRALLAADLDADGDIDLFVGGSILWRNDGAGNFARWNTPLPSSGMNTALGGDLDGDGDIDLVLYGYVPGAHFSEGYVFRQGPPGTYVLAGSVGQVWALFDFDADGDLDLLDAGYVHRNNGAGQFAFGLPLGVSSCGLPADLDRDGDLDLLAPGGAAANLHRQLVTLRPGRRGAPFPYEIWNWPGAGVRFVAPLLSLNLLPMPMVLPGVGLLFLDPSAAVIGAAAVLNPGEAVHRRAFLMPGTASLLGTTFAMQGVILEASQGRLLLTNFTRELVGF